MDHRKWKAIFWQNRTHVLIIKAQEYWNLVGIGNMIKEAIIMIGLPL